MGFRCVRCFWSGPFRRVGWFRRSVCSPPPPALFLAVCPSCVRFFLPLAFQGWTRLRPGVCVCNIWIDVKLLSLFLPLSSPFLILNSMQGGNLMFAADCPTKRAAFMTDMTPGRWSHVPANFIQKWEEAQPKNLNVTLFISSRLPQSVFSPKFYQTDLICMFQDSVPAGSYNDPFLSSVCYIYIYIFIYIYLFIVYFLHII